MCFRSLPNKLMLVNGAEDIVKYIEKKLNIKVGETTADGMFSLKVAECLGSCGTAPMLQCGASFHENLTYEKVDKILEPIIQSGRQIKEVTQI